MSVKAISPEVALAFGRDVYNGHGKIEILPKVAVRGVEDIAVAFTRGVGHAVKLIAAEHEAIHEQTAKGQPDRAGDRRNGRAGLWRCLAVVSHDRRLARTWWSDPNARVVT